MLLYVNVLDPYLDNVTNCEKIGGTLNVSVTHFGYMKKTVEIGRAHV